MTVRPRFMAYVGPAGILGISLFASVWQLWTVPILALVVLGLFLLSGHFRVTRFQGFLGAVCVSAYPIASLFQGQDLDHRYGMAVFLLLGIMGVLLGLHSSEESVSIGVTLFLGVVLLLTVWAFSADPIQATNQTPYHFGALTGPFGHRNTLGAYLGLAIVPLLLYPQRSLVVEIGRYALLVLACIALVASQSLTPVVALASLVFLGALISRHYLGWDEKRRYPLPAGLILFMSAVVVLVVLAVSLVLSEWRPTLGSRFAIWDLVTRKLIIDFPSPVPPGWLESREVFQELGFSPAHAHNSFLSLLMIYGILPTVVFLFALGGLFVSIARKGTPHSLALTHNGLVVPGLLLYMFVHSLVESTFLSGPIGALLCGTAIGVTLARSRPSAFE